MITISPQVLYMEEEVRFELTEPLARLDSFQDCCNQPLCHSSVFYLCLGRTRGIRTHTPRSCSPVHYHFAIVLYLEQDKRLELFSSAWKAKAQPIYQSCIMVRVAGFEPTISCTQNRRIRPDFPTLSYLVAGVRFELTTFCL